MAQDVVNFLTSQNIEKVILVGHSMGGKVAQALALLYPQFVEGLVVLDIGSMGSDVTGVGVDCCGTMFKS